MNPSADSMAETSDAGPGRMLARLRGERKLSVADVAQRLKYGARQIGALEAEEFNKLPGGTFVRGMVRGYAKLLDTDPGPILKELERRYVPGEILVDLRAKRSPFPEGGKRGTRAYLILSILIVVAFAGVLYEWRVGSLPWAKIATGIAQQKQESARPAATPVSESLPGAVQTAAPPVAIEQPATPRAKQAALVRSEGRILLEFSSDSWVEIKGRDGQTLMSQLNPAGTRRVVTGAPPMSLVVGNAAAVRLTYNDHPVNLKPYVQIEVARLTLE